MHEDTIRRERERFENIGIDRMLFSVQQHLDYPLFLDLEESRYMISQKYSMFSGRGPDVLYMRSHSKAYRPTKDGVNRLMVRFQVFREMKGVSLEEVVLPLLPESVVVKWMPRFISLADYIIPRHRPLSLLTTPEILAKFLLFWLSWTLEGRDLDNKDKGPENIVYEKIDIEDICDPVWGDPEATFSFKIVSPPQAETFFWVRKIMVPFFQMD